MQKVETGLFWWVSENESYSGSDQENQLPEFPPPAPLRETSTLQRHIIVVGLVAVILQLSVDMTEDGGPIAADSDGNFFANCSVILKWNTGPMCSLSIPGFAWFSLQPAGSYRLL